MTDDLYLKQRSEVNSLTGCREWSLTPGAQGYGWACRNAKKVSAHRLAFKTWVGPLKPTDLVRHKCDNTICIEPTHLESGSRTDNNRDTARRDRHGNAKLTNNDVVDIRWVHGLGASGGSLARAYGVTPTLISQIVNYKARILA